MRLRVPPLLVDALVALAILAWTLPLLPPPGGGGAVAMLATLVLCGSYPLRRRFALPVFAAAAVAAFAQTALAVDPLPSDLMLLLLVFHLATRFRWPVVLPAAGVTIGWVLLAFAPLLRRGWVNLGDVGVLVLLVAGAAAAGTGARLRRENVAVVQERARELERTRIARELHDIVSHSLSTMVVLADGAAATARTQPERAERAMMTVRDTGRSALADMRRMLGVLRDDEPGSHAPQPGIAQLEALVAESRAAGLPVTLTVTGGASGLAPSLDLAVYRLVQESLTNVRRHAGAVSAVEVTVDVATDAVDVRVTDDGAAAPDMPASGGHGLVGMRERVAAHGGSVQAGPRAGGGFEVAAHLPRETSRPEQSEAGRLAT